MNAYAPQLEWGPSWRLDQLYMVKLVGTYELPFGPGKKFLGSSGTLMSELVGGWHIGAILNYQGGTPLQIVNNYNPLLVNSFDRPNLVPGGAAKDLQLWQLEGVLHRQNRDPADTIHDQCLSKTLDLGRLATHSAPMHACASAAFENRELRRNQESSVLESACEPVCELTISTHLIARNFKNRIPNSLDSTFGQITNLSSQISNRQGQATFRVEF